jgi:hypothetical protein
LVVGDSRGRGVAGRWKRSRLDYCSGSEVAGDAGMRSLVSRWAIPLAKRGVSKGVTAKPIAYPPIVKQEKMPISFNINCRKMKSIQDKVFRAILTSYRYTIGSYQLPIDK